MDGCNEAATATAVRSGLKKGPWTAAEDAILIDYVRKHGEGNWNAVQKNTGLLRCGKSCRLRWANHLRPNLKKGSFSPEEEKIIIDLHAKMGNKWARMAAQLPGRTDNEIKNYWNTRMKRRQRAGLPLYPQEIQEEVNSFNFQSQKQHHKRFVPSDSPSSSSSFSSSPSHPQKRVCLNPFPNPSLNPIPNPSMNFQFFPLYNNFDGLNTIAYNETTTNTDNTNTNNSNNNNGCFGFSLPLSSSSSSNDLYNPTHLLELVSENSERNNNNNNNIIKINSNNNNNMNISSSNNNNNNSSRNIDLMSYSALLMGEEIEPVAFTSGLDNIPEFPSNQTSTHSLTPNALENENELLPTAAGNSGLLDALLEESQALCRSRGSKEIRVSSDLDDKEKKIDDSVMIENLLDDLSSPHQSSIGTNTNKNYEEPTMGDTMNSSSMVEDDDGLLMSLLNNFPSSTPSPDWYSGTGNQSDGSYFTSSGNGCGCGIYNVGNVQCNNIEPSPASTSGVDPMLGSCCWSNMPEIC